MRLEGFTDSSEVLRSGVYALVAKGKVIYIGKSKSMIARINTHRRKWIDRRKKDPFLSMINIPGLMFDEIHVRPVPIHLLAQVETEMINLYKPKYNVQLKTNAQITAPFNLTIAGRTITVNAKEPGLGIERRA